MFGRRLALLFTTWAGVLVTLILTVDHWTNHVLPCGSNLNGCDRVAHDAWARIDGVPVALFGLVAHLALGSLAIAALVRPTTIRTPLYNLGVFMAVACVFVSTAFMFRSTLVVHALCNWCLASGLLFCASCVLIVATSLGAEHQEAVASGPGLAVFIPGAAVLVGVSYLAFGSEPNNPRGVDKEAVASLTLPLPEGKAVRDAISLGGARHEEGPPTSPYGVMMFGDFTCPANHASFSAVRELCQSKGARFIFREFPLPAHEDAPQYARLAEMAPTDQLFWKLADRFMSEYPDDPVKLASEVFSIPESRLNERLGDPKDISASRFNADEALDHRLKLNETPTFILFRPSAKPRVSTYEQVMAILQRI